MSNRKLGFIVMTVIFATGIAIGAVSTYGYMSPKLDKADRDYETLQAEADQCALNHAGCLGKEIVREGVGANLITPEMWEMMTIEEDEVAREKYNDKCAPREKGVGE